MDGLTVAVWDTFTRKPGGVRDSSLASLDPLSDPAFNEFAGDPNFRLFRAESGYGVSYPGQVAIGFTTPGLNTDGYLVVERERVPGFLRRFRESLDVRLALNAPQPAAAPSSRVGGAWLTGILQPAVRESIGEASMNADVKGKAGAVDSWAKDNAGLLTVAGVLVGVVALVARRRS